MGEWPEFVVLLGSEIGMMCLMNDAIETEAHQTQRADHDAIELVEAAILSEKPVGRFVQADENAVHQMTDDEHERHRQPGQSAMHGYGEHRFSENQTENEKLKRTPQDPMRLMHLAEVFGGGGCVHWGWFSSSEIRLSGERQMPASTR